MTVIGNSEDNRNQHLVVHHVHHQHWRRDLPARVTPRPIVHARHSHGDVHIGPVTGTLLIIGGLCLLGFLLSQADQ